MVTSERPGNRLREFRWNNRFMDPLYETPYELNSIFVSGYSNLDDSFFLSIFLLPHSTPRLNSNTPREIYTANLKRWEIVKKKTLVLAVSPELSYHKNRAWRLAPSGPKSTRNVHDSAFRCTGRLQHTLGKAKNASMERTHTPVRFHVALYS